LTFQTQDLVGKLTTEEIGGGFSNIADLDPVRSVSSCLDTVPDVRDLIRIRIIGYKFVLNVV
jgi:hypothetical protein